MFKYSLFLALTCLIVNSFQSVPFDINHLQPAYKPACGAGGPTGPAKTIIVFDADETASFENFVKVRASESHFRNILGYDDGQVIDAFQDALDWAKNEYGVTFNGGAPACDFYEFESFYYSDDGRYRIYPFAAGLKTYTKVLDNIPRTVVNNNGNQQGGGNNGNGQGNQPSGYGNVEDYDPYCAFVNDGGFLMDVVQGGGVWGGRLGNGADANVGDLVVFGSYFFWREREDPRFIDKADPLKIDFFSYSPIKFFPELNGLQITCGVSNPVLGNGTAMGFVQYYFNEGNNPGQRDLVRQVIRNVLELVPAPYSYNGDDA